MTPGGSARDLRALTGRTVAGRYLLRDCLGAGAFGAVFLSDQHLLGAPMRRVALKLSKRTGMTPDDARDLFTDAFLLAEAMDTMTDSESRRHLVHVYDAGIAEDLDHRGYLVMEYVPGTTLAAQFSAYQRVPAPLLLKWVGQLCAALHGLHSLDPPLLHRDIKPDNVLLGPDNAVRLVDFGLAAKLLDLGHAPGVAGTTTYMAPETSQGRSAPTSDIYSLGVLIYEGLTGRHPFAHLVPPTDLPETLHPDWVHREKQRHPVPPPSVHLTLLSPALDEIVVRCLAFEPRERFHDVSELLAAVRAAGTARPVPGGQADPGGRADPGGQADPGGSRRAIERSLTRSSLTDQERFALLMELGAVLVASGDHTAAATVWLRAWQLNDGRALLRSHTGRADLLGRIAASYEALGNGYQAARFEAMRAGELRGSGR